MAVLQGKGQLDEPMNFLLSRIETYSQKMIGKSFREIWEGDTNPLVREGAVAESGYYVSAIVSDIKRNKGNLGQIIEERFFHYHCNGDSRPDFHEAGVELKVSPFIIPSIL